MPLFNSLKVAYLKNWQRWGINARYVVYIFAAILLLYYFKAHPGIYLYIIGFGLLLLIINFLIDRVIFYPPIKYALFISTIILDTVLIGFAVLITGGSKSPFFLLSFIQLILISLLGNLIIDVFFFGLNIVSYVIGVYLYGSLKSGSFVFIDKIISRTIVTTEPNRYDFILTTFVIFTIIVGIQFYVAERLKKNELAILREKNRLDFLLNVSESFRKLEPLDSFLYNITRMVRHSFGYSYNGIGLLNDNKTELTMYSYSPRKGVERVNNILGIELSKIRFIMSSGENYVAKAVKERASFIINDERLLFVDTIPSFQKEQAKAIQELTGTKTFILIPIIAVGDVIGVFEVESKNEQVEQDDIILLEKFVSQIGISILNNKLYSKTLMQKKEIENQYQGRNHVFSELQKAYSKLENFTSELELSKKKLEEMKGILYHTDKLASIGQVIASVTHQLSNPISVISGQSELLLRELDHDGITTGKDKIEKIINGTNKLNSFVKKLMLSIRQTKQEISLVNLNDLIKSIVMLWEYEFKTRGIELVIKLFVDLPQIEGISDALEQMIVNLISNARDAMEGKNGRVTIATRIFDKENVEVEVSDEGIGITDEDLSKIFNPFFTTKPSGKGTGLGMVIVMNAVQEHHGRILLKTKLNIGTTFTIILPIVHKKDL
ncbi:MAG: ATP-binding protein [Deltaproteobacteria bacterium]|nr:ATP-binding protein [Deltaproteobacteria bacterium]MCL5792445.1 ATP-binding protein [Deltaproteobacteria bacterium]